MLVEDIKTKKYLQRIVQSLRGEPDLHDDLMQESLIHLWKLENRRPGQRLSWYLQNCRFHLQHYLASGRSVDSRKRHKGRIQFPTSDESYQQLFPECEFHVEPVSAANIRDILSFLSKRLRKQEQAVLHGLAEGLPVQDIARRLKLSYPTAIKYRRKIASLAAKKGITPLRIFHEDISRRLPSVRSARPHACSA